MRTAEAKRIRLPIAAVNAIDAIYAELPKLNCKRLCQECCGPVFMEKVEWDRIIARVGYAPKVREDLVCPMLGSNGGCKVYDVRPAICRLWGVVDNPMMKCPHGCEPDRWLTDIEADAILKRIETASSTLAR